MSAEPSASAPSVFPGTRVPCPAAGNHLLLSAAALRERSAACIGCAVRGPCRTLYVPEVAEPGEPCWVTMALTHDQSRCRQCSVREHCHDLVHELNAVGRAAQSH